MIQSVGDVRGRRAPSSQAGSQEVAYHISRRRVRMLREVVVAISLDTFHL